jgi:peptide/nickel transport system permease protein
VTDSDVAATGLDSTATDSAFPQVAADEALAGLVGVSPSRRRLKKLVRNRGAMLAIAFLVLVLICAIFGHWLEPYNPNAIDILNRNASPSWSHWLGTDDLGRDILSRIIAGAAIAVRVSLQSVLVAFVIAIPIGLFSAYIGGTVDAVIMRFVDAGLSFPALVLALAIAGVLGPSVGNAAIAISVTMLPGFIRLVRGSALAVKHETYVEASRSVGVPTRRILLRRILPNIRSPLIVAASLAFGGAILAEAGLSFLGLSVQPPDASWGNMLRRAYDFSLFTYPWQLVIPGAVIALTILAYNTLGDGLRDTLSAAEWVPARHGTSVRDRFRRKGKARRGLTSVKTSTPTAVDRALTYPDELLSVEGLSVEFENEGVRLRVVDDVSFVVRRREVLGLVGESGSGKTVTSLSIMRLLPSPPGQIVNGAVYFENRDVLRMDFNEVRAIRGSSVAMVFQDPMSSLNPAFTIRDQLVEAYRLHNKVDKATANRRALEVLELVQIPGAAQRLGDYPHQLSGGMRQRVMLAMALICEPKLLIADEPTTALDVTVQAQILDLLRGLQEELDLSVIFVTHDLGVVADLCDRVAVMYAGQIVEQAPVRTLFAHPQHPYTEGLLRAMPQAGSPRDELYVIPGVVPSAAVMPTGCRFHPRCAYATDDCVDRPVALSPAPNGHDAGRDRHDENDAVVRCVRCDQLALRGAE